MKAAFLLTFMLIFTSHPLCASTEVPYFLLNDLLTWEYNAEKQKFVLNGTPITPRQVSFIERLPERDHRAGPLTKVALKVHFLGGAAPQVVYASAFDFRSKTGQLTQAPVEITRPLEPPRPQTCPGPVVSEAPPPPPRVPSSTSIDPAYMDAPLPYPQVIPDQTQYERIRAQAYADARRLGPRACREKLKEWYEENSVWKDLSKYDRALNVLAKANEHIRTSPKKRFTSRTYSQRFGLYCKKRILFFLSRVGQLHFLQ